MGFDWVSVRKGLLRATLTVQESAVQGRKEGHISPLSESRQSLGVARGWGPAARSLQFPETRLSPELPPKCLD